MDKLREYGTFLKEHKNMARAAVIIVVVIAAVVFFGQNGEKDEIPVQLPEENTEASAEAAPKEEKKADIYVDISGQIKKPGVYQVPDGTRLFEVIEMAGGLASEADSDGFNQAEIVSDGEKIIIPAEGEAADHPASLGTASGTNAGGLININNADSAALQEIPGVGPATADKIIAYRNENGRFASKEDIKNVSGIGDKTFEKMKDMITA